MKCNPYIHPGTTYCGKDIVLLIDGNGNVREAYKGSGRTGKPVAYIETAEGQNGYACYRARFLATGEISDWKDVQLRVCTWIADRLREGRYGHRSERPQYAEARS